MRGAYNKMSRLSPPGASPRRHRGVGRATMRRESRSPAGGLGIAATIVMPVTTPQIKIDAVRDLGGKVVLEGDSYDEADSRGAGGSHAAGSSRSSIRTTIPDVIAGQGTIGMEILRQCHDPIDAIFVPVGGGGLIAGIAAYVKRAAPRDARDRRRARRLRAP